LAYATSAFYKTSLLTYLLTYLFVNTMVNKIVNTQHVKV